jgi:CO dehydrogenase/acetyl-CoA synthase alpha subunit
MLTAAVFTVTKMWKQPKCPSISEWINELLYTYICMMEHYKIFKKNEILSFVITRMELETIMPNEIMQTQKTNSKWLHLQVESLKIDLLEYKDGYQRLSW